MNLGWVVLWSVFLAEKAVGVAIIASFWIRNSSCSSVREHLPFIDWTGLDRWGEWWIHAVARVSVRLVELCLEWLSGAFWASVFALGEDVLSLCGYSVWVAVVAGLWVWNSLGSTVCEVFLVINWASLDAWKDWWLEAIRSIYVWLIQVCGEGLHTVAFWLFAISSKALCLLILIETYTIRIAIESLLWIWNGLRFSILQDPSL